MTQSSAHLDPTRGPSSELTARERTDALLDEALGETFPASDSSAIGSGIAVIKQEDCERKNANQAGAVITPMTTRKPTEWPRGDGATP